MNDSKDHKAAAEPPPDCRVMRRVGWWVVFDQKNDMGEIPEGFFIDDHRAETFAQEPGWLYNHLVPCLIVHNAQGKPPAANERNKG